MKKALMIGGGFGGCTAAHQLELLGGWDCTVVEAAPFLGAGVRTSWWGGHPYTFGPRHFLTQKQEVFDFLNQYVPLRRCPEHEFLTYVERDNQFYNYPIHRDDVARMPDREKVEKELQVIKGSIAAKNLEEYWIAAVGPTLYDKCVNQYTKKMWMIDDCKVLDTYDWSPKGVALKEGPRACWDTAISSYPYAANGYDDYFDIATSKAKVLLNTKIEKYDIPNKRVLLKGEWQTFDLIINTLAPDMLFEQCHGELPFLGRDLHLLVFPSEFVFPENVYFLYYANTEKFTRMVEYKKFTKHKSPTTLVGLEFPSHNGKFYPIPTKAEQARAKKYYDMMPDGVFSIGRAGSYDYRVDIDDTIWEMMQIIKRLKSGDGGHGRPTPP